MPNIVTENGAVKWDHMPRRVPGLPHTVRSDRVRARILMVTAEVRRYGESFTSRATPTISTSPTDDARAKLAVQPRVCSAQASGPAAAIAPSWPT